MKYDLNKLNKYIEDGLIEKQVHPNYPLSIYNYTKTCSFEKKWDEYTISSRGLILDDEGNVIARPFEKFFNMEELPGLGIEIPNEPYEIFNKEDGSLGIIFHYDGEWRLASRGSFTSDQAVKGNELLKKYDLRHLAYDYTFVVEIIYPSNRIVVDYGNKEELILLGIIKNHNGKESSHDDLSHVGAVIGMPVVKKFDYNTDFKTLKAEVADNAEGYIIRFKNGLKMKVKGEEYCRLHRIITNVSNIDIYTAMRYDHSIEELLDRVPDEFYDWVGVVMNDIQKQFDEIERNGAIYVGYILSLDTTPTQKQIAEWVHTSVPKRYWAIVFAMLKGKDYKDMIFKQIRPKWSKPFSNMGTENSIYLQYQN